MPFLQNLMHLRALQPSFSEVLSAPPWSFCLPSLSRQIQLDFNFNFPYGILAEYMELTVRGPLLHLTTPGHLSRHFYDDAVKPYVRPICPVLVTGPVLNFLRR